MAGPLHWKTAEFRRLGLFSGIKRFTELEREIEKLADEKQTGDAFEVFNDCSTGDHSWPQRIDEP